MLLRLIWLLMRLLEPLGRKFDWRYIYFIVGCFLLLIVLHRLELQEWPSVYLLGIGGLFWLLAFVGLSRYLTDWWRNY
jgi:hypothetical protein